MQHELANKMIRVSLQDWKRLLGPDNINTIDCLSFLAAVLRRQGKYEMAEDMQRQALAGFEKLGSNHIRTVCSTSFLTLILDAQEKHGEAEEMNRRTLERYEMMFLPNHPLTLTAVNSRARIAHFQKDYQTALPACTHVIEGRLQLYGPLHPLTGEVVELRRQLSLEIEQVSSIPATPST